MLFDRWLKITILINAPKLQSSLLITALLNEYFVFSLQNLRRATRVVVLAVVEQKKACVDVILLTKNFLAMVFNEVLRKLRISIDATIFG